jgi:hypothetical protein
LKCIPTISADLQHTAIEADVGIWRRFKIEILVECYLRAAAGEKLD